MESLAELHAEARAVLGFGNEGDPRGLKAADHGNQIVAHGLSDIALEIGDGRLGDLRILRELVLAPIEQHAGASALCGGYHHVSGLNNV